MSSLTAESFLRRYRLLIVLTWVVPTIFGISFLIFIGAFSADQIRTMAERSGMGLVALITPLFALWYFNRFARPIVDYIRSPSPERGAVAIARVRRFTWHYWLIFIATIAVRPTMVLLSAERYLGIETVPLDWLRMHLMVIIIAILIGLPFFLRIFDLFGRVLGAEIGRPPYLTIKTKVFLIGALVPLLIDTMLVQYYWARTGYFTTETFGMWLALELLAIGGSLLFVTSFSQSLAPLASIFQRVKYSSNPDLDSMQAQSLDELGVLANDYRGHLRQQYEAEESLRGARHELNNMFDNMLDTFYRTDLDGKIIFITSRVEESLGYHANELLGRRMTDLYVDPEQREVLLAELKSKGEVTNFITSLYHKDGSVVWVSTNAHFYYDGTGALVGVEGNTRDITQLREIEEALHSEQQRALVTLESIGDGVITTDELGRVTYLNPVAELMTGWHEDEVAGQPLKELFQLFDEEGGLSVVDPVAHCLLLGDHAVVKGNPTLRNREGDREYSLKISASPLRDQVGSVSGVVIVFHDVTDLRSLAREMSYKATHDALTGLVNRREFEMRLDDALATAKQEGAGHALCYLDLDQFKVVNDSCGHRAGDELLVQLSTQLQECIRDSDTLARLGGDEFGVLLDHCPLERAQKITETLRQAVREFSFVWDGKSFEIGVSIGLVEISAESGTQAELLSAADSACYIAKDLGRNRVHVSHSGDEVVAEHQGQMRWVQRINEALKDDRFALYCQSVVPILDEDAPHYHEILVRMIDSDGSIIVPGQFLPAAERYNLMSAIDRWVVSNSLRAVSEAGDRVGKDLFAINLSGESISDASFLSFVVEQIDSSGVAPERICFEITETVAIANFMQANKFISLLRGMGCLFALDDFGSGLSSFGYLKRLSVNFLKIDGHLVHDIADNLVDQAMVEAINRIGHTMGVKTIAEFVENDEILARLRSIGVDYAQGYGIGRPCPLQQNVNFN